MTPEIAVQVPVKNGGETFRKFIKSLVNQDIQVPWELVIVDDASDLPLLEEFHVELGELPDLCIVKVERIQPGGNRPAARNRAFMVSEAEVALLMDADLEFDSTLLRRHLEVRKETGAQVVMGKRINAWSQNATAWQKWFDSRAMGNKPSGKFPWNYFITGNLSITNQLLKEAGGFDTAIDSYGGEDTEMGYRLNKMSVTFFWEPTLSVNHLDDVSVRKHSEKTLEYGGTGLKYTLEKHPEINGLLGSRWIEPVFAKPSHLCFIRLLTGFALLGPVYRTLLTVAEKYGKPSILFTYLAVGASLMGLSGKDYHK